MIQSVNYRDFHTGVLLRGMCLTTGLILWLHKLKSREVALENFFMEDSSYRQLWFTKVTVDTNDEPKSQKRCQNVSTMKCSKPVLHQNPLLFSRTVYLVRSNHAYITRYTTLAIIPSQLWSRILHRPETETWTICTLRLDPTEHIRYCHLQPET